MIKIHTPEEFEKMRAAGRMAAECLDFITPYVKPGVRTDELNELCHNWIVERGAIPAPLGYGPPDNPFPKSICTSVNHVICHGIPSDKTLREGDIINIDVTPIVDGWHGDTSRMFYVGKVGVKAKKLVEATFNAMWEGINIIKPGATVGDIGHAIQTYSEGLRYSVVKEFCGHGVGKVFHDLPNILHFGEAGTGDVLVEGMIFTVEPMLNVGKPDIRMLADNWTAVTKDKSLSAQFEHTVGVTANGVEVFTLSPSGLDKP